MKSPIIEELELLLKRSRNSHIDTWKAEGKKVIGYFCNYVPPEIIYAAGALPVRLRGAGSEDSSQGDAYLSGRICTYVRHVVSLILEEEYDYLDGEIATNSCDHVRRSADVMQKKSDIPYHGFVSIPRNPRESLFAYFKKELQKVYEELARECGHEMSNDALRGAIKTFNSTRRLLNKINALRMEDKPRFNGTESLIIHIASQILPPEVFRAYAEELLEERRQFEGFDTGAGRLLLIGAELDEPEFVETIESQGALVVADLLCFGARSVTDLIDEESDDPLDAIARTYFFRPSCARMIGDFQNRWEKLLQVFSESRADGVIFERIIFCDPWGAELHNLMHRIEKERRIPFLSLTREYGIVPTGQVRTRVQAFLEKIEIARLQATKSGGIS